VRTFEKGKFELVRVGGMTIGRATYEPGMEVVRACWASGRGVALQRGARGHGLSGLRHGRDGGWDDHELRAGTVFLHSARASGVMTVGWSAIDARTVGSLTLSGTEQYASK